MRGKLGKGSLREALSAGEAVYRRQDRLHISTAGGAFEGYPLLTARPVPGIPMGLCMASGWQANKKKGAPFRERVPGDARTPCKRRRRM